MLNLNKMKYNHRIKLTYLALHCRFRFTQFL